MKEWLNKNLHLLIIVAAVIVVGGVSFGVHLVHANGIKHQQSVASLALQARISADPLTVEQLYKDVNIERVKAGVAPLNLNQALVTSAQDKCNDMATNNYYDHVNPKTGKIGYSYIYDNLPNTGYIGENLDQNTVVTAGDVVTDWLNSAEHKKEMLNSVYTETGFGICKEASIPTIVEHFAQLRPVAPPPVTEQSTPITTNGQATDNTQQVAEQAQRQLDLNKTILCDQFKQIAGQLPPQCL